MTRKTTFFEGWSSFKFNNLGLALGTALATRYNIVAKGLKLKVRMFWGLIPTFLEVTGEKPVGGGEGGGFLYFPPPWIGFRLMITFVKNLLRVSVVFNSVWQFHLSQPNVPCLLPLNYQKVTVLLFSKKVFYCYFVFFIF